jgi:hypothetical protein
MLIDKSHLEEITEVLYYRILVREGLLVCQKTALCIIEEHFMNKLILDIDFMSSLSNYY